MPIRILEGNCLNVLDDLEEQSVYTCITSPPYFGLRDYDAEGQIGLETTPDEYVSNIVNVFRKVKRVLRDDGTVWLNLGDTYCGTGHKGEHKDPKYEEGRTAQKVAVNNKLEGFKSKDLIGIPWMVAFALRQDGWYLRQDIIWHKPNPMPESVKDRCTKAHEYIFLLSKKDKYYYDYESIKEEAVGETLFETRNKRSVWSVITEPLKEAHFAVFPPDLIKPCVLAGCPEGGTVLDPFGGAGTTGLVADRHDRNAILIELNKDYSEIARNRIYNDAPLFVDVIKTQFKN